jgi:hypothetical protein
MFDTVRIIVFSALLLPAWSDSALGQSFGSGAPDVELLSPQPGGVVAGKLAYKLKVTGLPANTKDSTAVFKVVLITDGNPGCPKMFRRDR